MLPLILICELIRPYTYPAFRDDTDGVDHTTVIGRNIPYSGMVLRKTEHTILIQKRGHAPREFLLSESLAAGRVPREATGGDRYSIGDLLIGDLVVITYGTLPHGNVCHAVSVHRRPGDRVPPADDDHPYTVHRWHDLANAKQDLEEKGIPVPRALLPTAAPATQRPSWFSWVAWANTTDTK